MMKIRKAADRGHFDHGWLKTFHTFSFAEYFDPDQMGFSVLRVINQDRVQPGGGFPTHPHKDMEILTYVLEGALSHRDSMGTGSTIRPGELQRMSAGTGVSHSEYNPSDKEDLHLIQIWIRPEKMNLPPSYAQKTFKREEKKGRLKLIASRDGADQSLTLNQDIRLYASVLSDNDRVLLENNPHRHLWIQVVRGNLLMNETALSEGDGVGVAGSERLTLTAGKSESEILVFDLP